MLTYRPYEVTDLSAVVNLQLSHCDMTEALDVSGARTVPEALEEAVAVSTKTWVALDPSGEICGVFGYAESKSYRIPWLLGNDELHRYPISLCKLGRGIVAEWAQEQHQMFNIIWSENRRSMRWLKFLGFVFPDHGIIPVNGRTYIKFHYDHGGTLCVNQQPS
jgi:hypothetical protein